MISDELINKILALSPEERRQLIQIIEDSLLEKPELPLTRRILGLGANTEFWMSDDFNDSLFPDDWMDDPSDPLNWKPKAE